MLSLEDIRNDPELANAIDWDMTPEEAVTLYLEWGNNWSHGSMVKSREDVSHYFVVNTWDDPPRVCLVRRNSDEAVDMALIPVPMGLREHLYRDLPRRRGVYAVTPQIREWLQREVLGEESVL